MATSIGVEIIPQGMLIPRVAIREWLDQDIEVIKDKERIIIQPKARPSAERERVLQILESSGLLVRPEWKATSPPVSSVEFTELAEKFSQGPPLSEIVIEEREGGW